MNIALWIVAVLLAVFFLLSGSNHAFRPLKALASDQRTRWVGDVPPAFVRFIGLSELLGVAGLILPAITGIQPWLTVLAAVGLGIVMLCAFVFHAARRELKALPVVAIPLALAVVVVLGRGVIASF